MINENFDIEQIKNKLKNTLNKKRYEHSLRVMEWILTGFSDAGLGRGIGVVGWLLLRSL